MSIFDELQNQESALSLGGKVKRVLHEEGIGGLAERGMRKIKMAFAGASRSEPYYAVVEEPPTEPPNTNELRKLKNKFKGKRCFIIGNGPSLNKLDLMKIQNEYSFGVNGIFYKTDDSGFRPTFYVVEDVMVMKENLERINAYETECKFFPAEYGNVITNRKNTLLFRMNRGFYEKKSPYFRMPRFSLDCAERIYCGQSVTMICLQLAFYMGFTEVYLIGMDFSYVVPDTSKVSGNRIESTGDDPNHFHPDYFGKGKHWHNPKLDLVLLNYQMAKFMYEAAGRKIFNATVGGKLEEFERVDYESLFEDSPR